MFFKLLLVGIIIGVGAYYYDLNSAEKILRDAEYSSRETEVRCRNNHESMCKYYMTLKLDQEKLFYEFQVPMEYYHGKKEEELKRQKYPVIFKQKKIFPARILDLEPKLRAKIDKTLEEQKTL